MHTLSCQNEMIKFQHIVKIKGKNQLLLLKQKWQSFCPNELHLCEKRASTYFLRGVGGGQWSLVIRETTLQTPSFAVVQIKLRGRPRNKVGLCRKFVLRVQDSEKLPGNYIVSKVESFLKSMNIKHHDLRRPSCRQWNGRQ